jgi:hypothetical protein
MNDAYQKDIFNSDLDAFKQSGIKTGSVTFSGVVGAGQEIDLATSPLAVDGLDFSQVLFDNSYYHSGRYRNLSLENATMINEVTNGSQLQANVGMKVVGNQIQLTAQLFNPYAVAVTLSTTTINFIYIPYQSTL